MVSFHAQRHIGCAAERGRTTQLSLSSSSTQKVVIPRSATPGVFSPWVCREGKSIHATHRNGREGTPRNVWFISTASSADNDNDDGTNNQVSEDRKVDSQFFKIVANLSTTTGHRCNSSAEFNTTAEISRSSSQHLSLTTVQRCGWGRDQGGPNSGYCRRRITFW